jgi:hypothetical protein
MEFDFEPQDLMKFGWAALIELGWQNNSWKEFGNSNFAIFSTYFKKLIKIHLNLALIYLRFGLISWSTLD